jgi:hypothetical protein
MKQDIRFCTTSDGVPRVRTIIDPTTAEAA